MRCSTTAAFLLLHLASAFAQSPDDRHWSPQFGPPGASYYVSGIHAHEGKVLVTQICAPAPSCPIQFWDGERWRDIGVMSGGIGVSQTAATDGENWFIGGNFNQIDQTQAQNVAAWDGAAWRSLGEGIPGIVYSLRFHNGTLYAGGEDETGPVLKSWNGLAWTDLSSAFPGEGRVLALASDGTDLFVAGSFTSPGSNIARWDGSNWYPLGAGLNDQVLGLAFWNGNLYAAGDFSTAGGLPASGIARWNGSQWESLGATFTGGNPSRLQVYNGELYLSGGFTAVNGQPANSLARYDGSFHPLPGHVAGDIFTLSADSSRLYFGGDFLYLGSDPELTQATLATGVGAWNGDTLDNLYSPEFSNGAGFTVFTLAHDGQNLYAGGNFRAIGDVSASQVARWDGSAWTGLASSIENRSSTTLPRVRAIAILNGEVFIGGTFTHVDGVAASNVAIWNGSNWRAAGAGLNGAVHRLVLHQDAIVATGDFSQSGSEFTFFVSRWNGATWQEAGCCLFASVTNGGAQEAVVDGSALYIGGSLTQSNAVYRLVGDSFELLGGFNNAISALAVANGILYVGGRFTSVNEQPISYLAQWNGLTWSAPGPQLPAQVRALAVHNGILHAGGDFPGLNYIARLQDGAWQPLGSGLNNSPPAPSRANELLSVGSDLYVAGIFVKAGQAYSYQLARWNDDIDFYASSNPTLEIVGLTGNQLQLRVQAPAGASITLQHSTDFIEWNPLATGVGTLEHTVNTDGHHQFFRAALE